MAGTGAYAEAVAGEAGSQHEAGDPCDGPDARNTVRRAVDIAGPGTGDAGLGEPGQKLDRAIMGETNGRPVRLGIENAHPFHRGRFVEPPAFECLMAGADTLEPARRKAAPALGEHGQELRCEPQ